MSRGDVSRRARGGVRRRRGVRRERTERTSALGYVLVYSWLLLPGVLFLCVGEARLAVLTVVAPLSVPIRIGSSELIALGLGTLAVMSAYLVRPRPWTGVFSAVAALWWAYLGFLYVVLMNSS